MIWDFEKQEKKSTLMVAAIVAVSELQIGREYLLENSNNFWYVWNI